ncbi:dihydrofolate synthase [Ceratobasidium sp. AG-Ba]|nr:dihydrofolate synthase [Ceratobasidium sp. AG-Ba]QRW15353.1 dihydrofolate synthase [Ceratobasidium sp. AG-Ba]
MVETVLRHAGFSTGRFNSPHLIDVWDSIKLDTRSISEAQYTAARQKIQQLNNEHQIGASSFELHTVSALSFFQDTEVDVVVLEVGMGGLTDATNVIPDESVAVSAITSIDYDHQGFLGNTIQEITSHKVGIVRPNSICVMGTQASPEAASAIREKVKALGSQLVETQPAIERQWNTDVDGSSTSTLSQPSLIPPLLRPCTASLPVRGGMLPVVIPLHGQHQLENLATAVSALDALRAHPACTSKFPDFQKISDRHIIDGLRESQWPGRLSWHTLASPSISDKPVSVLVDGAHNAASAQALSKYIDSLSQSIRPVFVLALSYSPAKPPSTTLSPLLQPGDRVITTTFSPVRDMPWVRHVDLEEMTESAETLVGSNGYVHAAEGLEDALAKAGELLGNEGYVVLAGSLYLVADFYRILGGGKSFTI